MITLPIYFHSEETAKFKQVGIDYKLEDCETRDLLFININAIGPYIEDGEEVSTCTSVFCNGSEFICSLKYNEVKKLIKK